MDRRRLFPRVVALLLLPCVVHCAGAGVEGSARPPDKREAAALTLPHRLDATSTGALVFPPAKSALVPNESLEKLGFSVAGRAPRVVAPSLDGDGRFVFVGRSLRISLDDAAKDASGDASAFVKLSPAVPFEARWVTPSELELTLKTQPDPALGFTLSVGPFGGNLPPWTGMFHAQPSVRLAGKELGYVPSAGHVRPVVLAPSSYREVGRHESLRVLFDQAVDLGLARKLISLRDKQGEYSFVVDYARDKTFEGVVVPARHAIVVRPASPLPIGADVSLAVKSESADDGSFAKEGSWTVAGAFAATGVGCGHGWSDSPCPTSGGRLLLEDRAFHVLLTTPVDGYGDALKKHVTVVPAVKGLQVYGESWSSPRLVIQGDFAPSTSYQVVLSGLVDRYGQKLRAPFSFTVATRPEDASLAAPEGLVTLDQTTLRGFPVTTRNVLEAELLLWAVGSDGAALEAALGRARSHELPEGAPTSVLRVSPREQRDGTSTTRVDLSKLIEPGKSYLASVRATAYLPGTRAFEHAAGSEASKPPVALLHGSGPAALAVHAHVLPSGALVRVGRLVSGEPVPGAELRLTADAASPAAVADASGMAWIPGNPTRLWASAGAERVLLPLDEGGMNAEEAYPELARGAAAGLSDTRALVLTDRGIYRPGSRVSWKGLVRTLAGDKLVPAPSREVRVVDLGPDGERVEVARGSTNALGALAASFDLPAAASLGRHTLRLEAAEQEEPALATTELRVAEFEPPRFTVDVTAKASGKGASQGIEADVVGRYLFGAAMAGASVTWSVSRKPAELPEGNLAARGLLFTAEESWWDEDEGDALTKSGSGALDASGTLHFTQPIPWGAKPSPERITVEADVTDASYRHVAARATVLRHAAPRYAGLRVARSWLGVGEDVPVELGVVDTEGKTVAGRAVSAVLSRISWRYAKRRGPSGSAVWEWSAERRPAGRCEVTSALEPVTCKLHVSQEGSYELVATTEGRAGGSVSVWAWADGEEGTPFPTRGRQLPLSLDKTRYQPGDTARVFAPSPFADATAILTVEQGGLVAHETKRVRGGGVVFDVPVSAASAPWVHATLTLLPMGAKGDTVGEQRVGAVRIPVSVDGARLDLAVTTDRPSYGPGEEVRVAVDARLGKAGVAGADVLVYAVDEGVLRLTSYEVPDPVTGLRPGRALGFRAVDSREGLAELLSLRHVAGDGGGPEVGAMSETRKRFVETAAWLPELRTDANGHVEARFRLPDNLTTFRVMAFVVDGEGRGGSVSSKLTVQKPLLVSPIVPRFALRGDKLELAAQVASSADVPVHAMVRLGAESRSVTLPARGQLRVPFAFTAARSGTQRLRFSVLDEGGTERDAAEVPLVIDEPGIDERPRLAGAFSGERDIALAIPASVLLRGDETLQLLVGEHLYPELGERLRYLLGYPHGCVEQTTSSTLPLLAARDILPRIGVPSLSRGELDTRIRAGLERLGTMRTPSGGLAYWPGGAEPNVYGTAYAARAFALAKKAGIAVPEDVWDDMVSYLRGELLGSDVPPEVQSAIAQTLAEMGSLEAGTADALFDRAAGQTVFGAASLALALSALPGQHERVEKLLDGVEAALDERGALRGSVGSDDFYYYGSTTRTRSQAAIALAELRPTSRLLLPLLGELAHGIEGYTTQATAYSLLALATHLRSTPESGTRVRAYLDGLELTPSEQLGAGGLGFSVSLSELRGRAAALRLVAEGERAISYQLAASWRRPFVSDAKVAAGHETAGPEVHRLITDPSGNPLDLSRLEAGALVRVALLVRLPSGLASDRRGYLALTDRLPAGLEAVDPELASSAAVAEVGPKHPFSELLRWGAGDPSHVELRDDRVNLYFDRVNDDTLAATYLARATTPGTFVMPPAMAELMYEPESGGWSEALLVTVR
jgi:uncharacterized protein YfaS (alpha-2-macroglobulin family)